MLSRAIRVVTIVLALPLVGCETPRHSNTLIFGTNTTFALDVSAGATGSPSVTLGYKRQEAVWMPLLANQDENGKPAACGNNCLFIGVDDAAGKPDQDTYSVLASFGAKATGNASTSSGGNASGGAQLAQFFATGLAARVAAVRAADLLAVQAEYKLTPEREAAALARVAGRRGTIEAILPRLVDATGKLEEPKLKKIFEPEFADIPKSFKGKAPGELNAELQKYEYAPFIDTFKKRADAL